MSVEKDIDKFVGDSKKISVPKPPKKGEIIICQVCGEKMLPENFSKNEMERKREFKWHCHWDCMQKKFNECDRKTPGLLGERSR